MVAVINKFRFCFIGDSTLHGRGLIRNGSAPNLAQTSLLNKSGVPQALSYKDVSRIWSNESVNVRSMSPVMPAVSSAVIV